MKTNNQYIMILFPFVITSTYNIPLFARTQYSKIIPPQNYPPAEIITPQNYPPAEIIPPQNLRC